MDSRKYTDDAPGAKRALRHPVVAKRLADMRELPKQLEKKLTERNEEIAKLRKEFQAIIDSGTWNEKWTELGFKKKEAA